ncbi:MAG TPA: response regulator [Actinomycetota bacterium]
MNVLIVDDAADIRLMLRYALGHLGFSVAEAASGVEALEILESEPLPDAVVLDIQMPLMDGLETLRSIRRSVRASSLPIVLCSVKSREVDLEEGWRLGCDGYVTKPFDIDDIVEAIRAAIARRNGAAV